MNKSHRFIFLDGLRGIAAIAVMIFHFSAQGGHRVPYLLSAPLAVDLFFCMSGFVIAYTYYQRLTEGMSYGLYLKKRLIRLYPMFVVGLLLGVCAFAIKYYFDINKYTPVEILKSTLLNVVYLPYFPSPVAGRTDGLFLINSPSWSLFFELIANIAFLFTISLSKNKLIFLTAVLGVALAYAGCHYGTSPGWSTENFLGGFPRVGYSFMMGVLIFKFFEKVKELPKFNPFLLIIILITLFALPMQWHVKYWILSALVLLPVIVILGANVVIINPLFDKVCTYLGWISYPIYCIHNPMLHNMLAFFPQPTHYLAAISILMILTIIIAHIFAKYIDEPLRAWLSRPKSSEA